MHPTQPSVAVLDRNRKWKLGREPVVDREHDAPDRDCDAGAIGVVLVDGAETERTPVEEDVGCEPVLVGRPVGAHGERGAIEAVDRVIPLVGERWGGIEQALECGEPHRVLGRTNLGDRSRPIRRRSVPLGLHAGPQPWMERCVGGVLERHRNPVGFAGFSPRPAPVRPCDGPGDPYGRRRGAGPAREP